MKASTILLAGCLAGLVASVLAFLLGLGGLGIAAGILALTAAGAGLALANDDSRHAAGHPTDVEVTLQA